MVYCEVGCLFDVGFMLRAPHEGSVLDAKLGISNKMDKCATCNQKLADCTGHFGYIRLHLPVFHVGLLGDTIKLLQCICKTCSRVMLMPEERGSYLKKFRNPKAEQLAKKASFEKVRRFDMLDWRKFHDYFKHIFASIEQVAMRIARSICFLFTM